MHGSITALAHRRACMHEREHEHAAGFFINCGSKKESTINGFKWLTDDGFVGEGNRSEIATPGVAPVLASLRYFPYPAARKSCYIFPVAKGSTYLVRTTYYYGAFDGGSSPPVFDQIVSGTRWSAVNTSADYARGLASYYEIIVGATGKTLSVCVARNAATAPSASPFISAVEVESVDDSVYNTTDFSAYALATVARHRFGGPGPILSYPDDPFNRYWESFDDGGKNPVVQSHGKVDPSEFWNLPPAAAFVSGLTASRGKQLALQWPAADLPSGGYYVALYFQDYRTPSPYSWRVFDVAVNGKIFYKGLNVSAAGVTVYATNWPLGGKTEITLTPEEGSPVGPVINAGEVLQLVPLEGRTVTRDVIAMEEVARKLSKVPSDWRGDPCLPKGNSWTGVTCSEGKLVRVVSL
ncbi:hypothetical protein Taro_017385 [Colocasia esculenta]|uniref:Malectin-like domain-containing protein n=1 Tax=Colocasia esculenta TaxID=4460 RepID=A0A843UN13_COLES|nr:hypothetical protein [Colocasia esculenta]